MARGKIKTYIQGFDEHLGGGIPEESIVLVTGETGTMRSSIAYSILYNNALKEGKKGVYISLEQSRKSLLQNMDALGMPYKPVEDKLSVLDLGLIRKSLKTVGNQSWMQVFKMYAENLKNNSNYDLLVLDTLSVLEVLADFKDPRTELFHFFVWLRDLKVTSFLVSEMKPNSPEYGKYDEDFLSDGVFHLKMEKVGDINIQRRIRCVKLRSAQHSPNFYTLLHSDGKFEVTRVIAETNPLF